MSCKLNSGPYVNIWGFGACSRVHQWCSEGVLATPLTTRTHSMIWMHRNLNRKSSTSQLSAQALAEPQSCPEQFVPFHKYTYRYVMIKTTGRRNKMNMCHDSKISHIEFL